MAIKENSKEIEGSNVSLSSHYRDLNINGLTKEKLLLKNLKDIAEEYIELEKIKNKFAHIVLKNQNLLDFSEFIQSPRFSIKESSLIKKGFSANIRGLNIVSVDGSSVSKKFMNVDFSFLKAIAVKYYFKKN
ncbi:hypothetical protein LCGC14_1376370, partial [marine sediment metagenome]